MEVNNITTEKKFGFKGLSLGKNVAPKKLQPGVLNEEVIEKNETDFITGVEGKEIESESGKKTNPEEIVIPMQPNSLFKGLKRGITEEKNESKSSKKQKIQKTDSQIARLGNELEANAINELLEEAERDNENWENRDLEAPKNLTIPANVNRPLNEDDSDAESEKEDTDYEKVPISAFGLAMLRGMGWKDGEGIGTGDRKKVVDPIQAVARPRGLGLGADRSAHQMKNQVNGKSYSKNKDDEELELKKGAFCQITQGKNEDMYGEIVSIDEESTRIHVKLTLGDTVSISQFKTRLVSKTEYGKYSKYINKRKADKYKEDERKKEEWRESKEKNEKPDRDEKKGRRDDRDYRKDEKKKSQEKHKVRNWLRQQLRVRIVDKNFSKGKYFKQKVRILDVMGDTCQCRTDDGKLLDLKQNQLETVIPRDGPFVCLIAGKYAGLLGEILEKDKYRCVAMVQLLSDRDRVLEMAYDDICEYTGDIDADLDY